MVQIQIDEESCVKCPECTIICPTKVFAQEAPETIPTVTAPEKCFGCFSCVDVCRADAINIEDVHIASSYIKNLKEERKIREFIQKLI
ncbi:MAG: ferredoxin family protein [Candidatus Hodarchaeota archaeon]